MTRGTAGKKASGDTAQKRGAPSRLEPGATGRQASCPSGEPEHPAPPIHAEVTPERVQSALVTALQSREFQSAPQLRAFLGFVVRATLNNEQEKLKGYTIAVEALGRPEDFNPVTDPIVRVEAARLRRRLEKYYAGSGAGDPVRIDIPKGSYAPEFHPACGESAARPPTEGMLAFEEEGSSFEAPATSALQTNADLAVIIARDMVPLAPAAAPLTEPAAAATGLARDTGASFSVGRLFHKPVPLPLALLIAVLCFLAGYLVAAP